MTGAANRRKGHVTERMVVAWLREHGHPDAATTRSRLGHDGFSAPGDVIGVPGLVVEVKDVQSGSRWPTWCRQAAAEAQGTPWCVVRRTRGQTDVGRWLCVASDSAATSVPAKRYLVPTLRRALNIVPTRAEADRWPCTVLDRRVVVAGRFEDLFDTAEVPS